MMAKEPSINQLLQGIIGKIILGISLNILIIMGVL